MSLSRSLAIGMIAFVVTAVAILIDHHLAGAVLA
jgi:hypothetical protein